MGVRAKILLQLYRNLSHMLKNSTEVENYYSSSSIYATSRGLEVHFQNGEHKVVQGT
jgi:hypothetical protein